jgi:hypothetical protein
MVHLLSRNIRFEEDLIDQLFNSSERRLAWVLSLPFNPSRCSEDPAAAVRHYHRVLTPKDTLRGPTYSVWSFRRQAEEGRGEPR